jgi:hypothetical protein
MSIDIEKIKTLSLTQLEDAKNFEEIKSTILEFEQNGEFGDGKDFAVEFTKLISSFPEFSDRNPDLYKAYQDLMLQLKFIALPFEPINEIRDLFGKNLIYALDLGIDVKEKIELLFLIHQDDISGENFRREIIKALKENEEKIGKEIIFKEERVKEVKSQPFIKNWLTDYDRFFEAGKLRGSLEEITYLNQSPNVQKLPEKERDTLFKIIRFYDLLRFRIVGGWIKTGIPVQYVTKRATEIEREMERGAEEAKAPDRKTKIIQKYLDDPKEQGILRKEKAGLIKATGGSTNKVIDFLYNYFFPPIPGRSDKYKIIVSLRFLAEKNKLDYLINEDKRFRGQFIIFLKEREATYPGLLESFRIDSAIPSTMSLFLQYLLKERARLSEDESAKIGMQLVNLLKKTGNEKYGDIVFYDFKKEQFLWKSSI